MRIAYLANIRLPTEKAHGSQIMNMSAAFAAAGHDVTLIIPRRRNPMKADPFEYYGVSHSFIIRRIFILDFLALPFLKQIGFIFESISFNKALHWHLLFKKYDVYYTRDLSVAAGLFTRKPLFYEIHSLPERVTWLHRRAWRRAKGIVVISDGLRKALVALGVPESKILLARDAVDVKKFQIPEGRNECRVKLNLPADKKIVVYTGHLYSWKGADILAQAAAFLPQIAEVYLVGGTQDDITRFKSLYRAPNLHIVGWQAPPLVPYWLKAADVLVIPNSAKEPIGAEYTSPLKLFEYMASGTPIVASRVSAIREIISEGDALFFEPDNIQGLTVAVSRMLNDNQPPSGMWRGRLADFTWEWRAKVISDFIKR